MDAVNGVRTRLGDPIPVNFDLQKLAQQRAAKAAQATAAAASGTAPVLSKEQERGMTKEQKEAYDKAIKDRETSMKKNKELNDAFTSLNQLLASWNTEGASVAARKRLLMNVFGMNGPYSLSERPVRIESASVASGGMRNTTWLMIVAKIMAPKPAQITLRARA